MRFRENLRLAPGVKKRGILDEEDPEDQGEYRRITREAIENTSAKSTEDRRERNESILKWHNII